MVSLICIDVDGTLVGSSGKVPPEVWPVADRVAAHGIRLAICSGRPAFGLARSIADRLKGGPWHIFQNGASVVDVASGESRSRGLSPRAVERLVEKARATGRALELYTDTGYAVESTADRAQRHAGLLGVPFEPRGFDSLRGRIVRAQWLLAHEEVDAVLSEPHEELNLSPSHSPVMPDTTFLNMTPQGVDKATAVRSLAEVYGVPLENVMMIGDGHNDLTALQAVGHAVAMGNAEPEVHEVAHHTVAHVDQGGLVEAFELALSLSGIDIPASLSASPTSGA